MVLGQLAIELGGGNYNTSYTKIPVSLKIKIFLKPKTQ